MAVYGYARCSSLDGDASIETQAEKLRGAGAQVVRCEKASGTSRQGRPELETLLEFVRFGDEIVCTRIDRLARSLSDLLVIVSDLQSRGVTLRCLDQPVATSNAAGRAFLQMLGVFAEFETNLRRERQMEGIAKAKSKGVYKGRKPCIDREQVIRLKSEGKRPSEIARVLRIGRASVYRVLDAS